MYSHKKAFPLQIANLLAIKNPMFANLNSQKQREEEGGRRKDMTSILSDGT